METKYKKGDMVSFFRNNSIKAEATEIISVVPMLDTVSAKVEQKYVVEHPLGWIPNAIREKEFSLNFEKKYLFVSEKELGDIK